MKKILFIFLFPPAISFSQIVSKNDLIGKAIIKNLYLTAKHRHTIDTIKSVSYPLLYTSAGDLSVSINKIIKATVFNTKEYDTAQSIDKLLRERYKKDNSFAITNKINRNKNGYLSLTMLIASKGGPKPPIYLNFDLSDEKKITLKDLLNTKNDSISFRQAVIPLLTDSIMTLEQTINRNNPKYSDIIEQLNSSLSAFMHQYMYNFIMTDKELIICYDCILPSGLYPYNHTFRENFKYKVLRGIFKTPVAWKLQ